MESRLPAAYLERRSSTAIYRARTERPGPRRSRGVVDQPESSRPGARSRSWSCGVCRVRSCDIGGLGSRWSWQTTQPRPRSREFRAKLEALRSGATEGERGAGQSPRREVDPARVARRGQGNVATSARHDRARSTAIKARAYSFSILVEDAARRGAWSGCTRAARRGARRRGRGALRARRCRGGRVGVRGPRCGRRDSLARRTARGLGEGSARRARPRRWSPIAVDARS